MIQDGILRTEDMVEATVFSMHGHTPSFERSENGRGAVFVFDFSESMDDPEFLEGLFDELRSARCRVEPKRFAREMRHIREMLYDFLQVTHQPRRSSPRA